jgi:hypothetical protein
MNQRSYSQLLLFFAVEHSEPNGIVYIVYQEDVLPTV